MITGEVSSKITGLMRQAQQSVTNTPVLVNGRLTQLRLIGQVNFPIRDEPLYHWSNNRQLLALHLEALSRLKEANNKKVGEKLLQI